MKKTDSYSNICKYLCIIAAIAATMIRTPVAVFPQLILISLFIFINSQVRIILLKNSLFIASLLLEVLIVGVLYSMVGGLIYLILFATLIDSVIYLKGEAYFLFALNAVVLTYSLYNSHSIEWVMVILFFYIIIFLLLIHLRQELSIREDTELLYDQLRKTNYELEATKSRLYEYSKQVEKVSQLEERNRISRELHDSIGHSLTGILMQVDAALQHIPIDQKKGLEILTSAYENINNSIEGVRQAVRRLRPSIYQTQMTSLRELTKKFEKDTGVKIELLITGTPYELYPSIEITLYKNTREALTNAVRHGSAQNIEICLNYSFDHIQLTIQDDGIGSSGVKKGFGLSGMEERLELVEGTLMYSGEKGFCISMIIPRKEIV